MVELFANIGDPNQTVASGLGLHCLSVTRLGVSSSQWVNDHWTLLSLLIFIYIFYFLLFIDIPK